MTKHHNEVKRTGKITLKVLAWVVALHLLTPIALVGGFLLLNATGHINNLAQRFMNAHLVGEMRFDSLRFDFSEFPTIGVSARNGVLLSDTMRHPSDTMASFHILVAKMNPFKVFTDSLIDIPYAYLDRPTAVVLLSDEGRPGWAIWRFRSQKREQERKREHKHSKIKLNIAHVEVTGNPRFYYHNYHTGMEIAADAADLYFDGRICIDYKKMDVDTFHLHHLNYRMTIPKALTLIDTRSDSICVKKVGLHPMNTYTLRVATDMDTVFAKGRPLLEDNRLYAAGNVSVGYHYQAIRVNSLRIGLDATRFAMEGSFRKVPHIKAMHTDVSLSLSAPMLSQTVADMTALRRVIPQQLQLLVPFDARIDLRGIFSPSLRIYPDAFARFHIGEGSIRFAPYPTLHDVDLLLRIDYQTMKNHGDIYLDNMRLRAMNSTFALSLQLLDFTRSMRLRTQVDYGVDLADLSRFVRQLPMIGGTLDGRLTLNAPLRRLITSDLGGLDLDFSTRGTSLSLAQPQGQLLAPRFNLCFNLPQSGPAALRFDADSLRVLTGGSTVSASDASVSLTAERVKELLGALFEKANTSDSLCERLDSVSLNILFAANRADYMSQKATASLASVNLASQAGVWLDAAKKSFGLGDASASIAASDLVAALAADSTSARLAWLNLCLDANLIDSTYSGRLCLGPAVVATPVVPLRNRLDSLALSFTPESVWLEGVALQCGASRLTAGGRVDNLVGYLRGSDTLRADVAVRADSFNLNELVPALTRGAFYLSKSKASASAIDSLTERMIPPRLLPPSEPKHRSKAVMPKLPPCIDALVSVDATNVAYDGVTFDESHGRLLVANSSLYLSNMFVDSNLGDVEVALNYLASDTALAHAEAGVRIERLDVDRVIDLFPDFSRMVPPLRTLRGEVGCELYAEADLDSTFYLTLPTLGGNAELTGSHLAVAKAQLMPKFVGRLLFGRNPDIVLDTLAIRLSMADDVVSVYPFTLSVNNRYRIAAAGVQNEKERFFYHGALLRWFLPFRLGVDVYRDEARRRFRLARPRLKSNAAIGRLTGIDTTLIFPDPNARRAVGEGFERMREEFEGAR